MVRLLDMKLEHLPFFLTVRNECRLMLHDQNEFTLDQCLEWFNNIEENKKYYIINVDEMNVGYVRINYEKDGVAVIGCDICKECRKRGYATEAYRKVINLLYVVDKIKTFKLCVRKTNLPAISLYLKLGFVFTNIHDIDYEMEFKISKDNHEV